MAFAQAEQAERQARDLDQPEHVDVERAPRVIGVGVRQGHDLADAGVVDEDVEAAVAGAQALVGRLEVRDWVDNLECSERLQPLGYLAWAACGKDPGFSPLSLVEHGARTARYSAEEVQMLAFAGSPPDAGDLSRRWHSQLEAPRSIVAALPAQEAGKCVIDQAGQLAREPASALTGPLIQSLHFHAGSIRGALPQIRIP